MRNLIIGNQYSTRSNANLIINLHSRKIIFKLETTEKYHLKKYRVIDNRSAQE